MTSLVFSIFLLLQAGLPNAGVRAVPGRISIDGDNPIPSSFTLAVSGSGTTAPPIRTLMIRPQIDGAFRVQAPAGEYRVGAAVGLPPGYVLQSVVYGGVDILNNPLKIAANDSAELLIKLALNGPSPAVSVSGRVTGIAPGQVQRIALREPTGGDLSAALETSIGPDGAFTFPKVLPGNYIVYLRLRAQTRVTVGSKDVTGVTVSYPQDILVSGHVIAEGPQTTIPEILIEGNGRRATSQNARTGTFVLSLENGENTVRVTNIPEPYSLKSMTYGDVDLQKAPLKLDGPALWDIVVRVAPRR